MHVHRRTHSRVALACSVQRIMKTAGRFANLLLAVLATAGSVSASRAGGRASASVAGGGGVGRMHSANEVALPRVDAVLDEPLITRSGIDADTAKAAATVTGGQAVAQVGHASRKS